jgi:REP element-mobilizing transposase RayT
MIDNFWMQQLHSYIAAIINKKGHNAIIVGGIEDHVHILFKYKASEQNISDLVRDIKKSSSTWVHNNFITTCKFAWQDGYGVFSYSRDQVENVTRYIKNQDAHHHIGNIDQKEEFRRLLRVRNIPFDERYLPDLE